MGAVPDRSFATQWPALEKQLTAMLARRRIPACLREDIVQEAGLRLWRNWDRIDPKRSVWPFAMTIALNLVRDEIRNRALMERKLAIADEPIPLDIEELALTRIELEWVAEALNKLTVAQRAALLAEVGAQSSERVNTPAIKMLRMRARRRLKVMLEEASAVVAPLGWSLRAFYRRFEEALAKFATDAFSALSSASICLLCVAAAFVPALSSSENGLFGGGDSRAPGEHESQTTSFSAGGPNNSRAGNVRSTMTSDASHIAATEAAPSGRMRTPGPGGPSVHVGDDGVDLDEGANDVGPDGYRFSKRGRIRVAGQRVRVNLYSEYRPSQEGRDGPSTNRKDKAGLPYVGVKVKYNGENREVGVGDKPDDHN
jgi:RNA polymerase sigma factor (sigma-70 family)